MLYLDLDGTLLDVEKRHYASYVDVLNHPDLRGVPIPQKQYWGFRIEGKSAREILQKSRLMPNKFQAFTERFEERMETPEMLSLDRPREGVVTALGKLYTKTPICLVTLRRDRTELENQLASLGWKKYFASVLCGAAVQGRRPNPEIRAKTKADHVRKYYKMLPTEALYIGDTETDVKAARLLGFQVWLVEGGNRTKELQMKAEPNRIVADLSASLKHLLPGGRWQL